MLIVLTRFHVINVFSHHHHHHHHHIALVARISLTLSRHSSLGRSSGQHPVSSHSCWMYVRAGRPAFARPCVGVHKSTSLMSSSLLLQQCPACLVRLTWIVFVIGGRWPYSWCLVGCCRQNLFKIARSISNKHENFSSILSTTNVYPPRYLCASYQIQSDRRVYHWITYSNLEWPRRLIPRSQSWKTRVSQYIRKIPNLLNFTVCSCLLTRRYINTISIHYLLRLLTVNVNRSGESRWCSTTKTQSWRYPAESITDSDYADDPVFLANTSA